MFAMNLQLTVQKPERTVSVSWVKATKSWNVWHLHYKTKSDQLSANGKDGFKPKKWRFYSTLELTKP
jgi:hypothetical protein